MPKLKMNKSIFSHGGIFSNEKQNDYFRAIYFISIFVLPDAEAEEKI